MHKLLIPLLLAVLLSACDSNTVGLVATGLQTANKTLTGAQEQAKTYTPCLSSAAQSLVGTLSASPNGSADPSVANAIIADTANCLKQSADSNPSTNYAPAYYCPAASAYYPQVQQCPGGWQIQ